MERTNYWKLPGLEHVVLEDSYVMDFAEEPTRLSFALSLVLAESHPLYTPPRPDEAYCYRRATLRFPAVARVTWRRRDFRPYRDANDEVDYGEIDVFFLEGGRYHLEGDWGIVDIESAPPSLSIEGQPE